MSLTIHYFSANWELKSKCLETVFMPESHTGDNLAEALRYLVKRKLACITTDNGVNTGAAVRKLGWQRWGTTQKMIEHVLEQTTAIKRVLDDRRSQHLIPTWQDIEVLESVNAALKKVADFTDALSSEKTVRASSVKQVLLSEDLLLPTKEDTELTRNLKIKMTGVLEDKYNAPATQQLLAKASFAHPRYKDINPVDDVKDALLEEMLAVPEECCDHRDGAMRASKAGEGQGASAPAPGPKKMSLADLLGKRKDLHSTPQENPCGH
ncbi:hypothetical protein MHYP_G00151310 [Metynnis hypsauchen]